MKHWEWREFDTLRFGVRAKRECDIGVRNEEYGQIAWLVQNYRMGDWGSGIKHTHGSLNKWFGG